MKEISFIEAMTDGLKEEMTRNENIVVMGEDVSVSVLGLERGLKAAFPNRVIDTPISEAGFVGLAVGAAIEGLRPYVSITYANFLYTAMDQISNHAAKLRFLSGGQVKVPIVICTTIGRGRAAGAQHSETIISPFMHIPGLKVVTPSTPYDAKGLLKTSLRDDNPIILFTHLLLLRDVKSKVPAEDYTIPLGVADVKKEGNDVTIVTLLYMVHEALAAARDLEKRGISAEVVDLRTVTPLDEKTILDSVKKTGRLVIVEEEVKRGGVGAEIAATVTEKGFDYLDAPIRRLGALFTPVPHSPVQEKHMMPNCDSIVKAIGEIV